MSRQILVSTRKGLFTVDRSTTSRSGWMIGRADFVGDNVTLALHDPRSGHRYAALDHGHFGVKLHRSKDAGETWEEIAAPAYPERPEDADDVDPNTGEDVPWTLKLIWALETGGPDQEGLLWCGTIPGGLFVSPDHGDSWELVRSLWDHPDRREWMGGGADLPGIHSIIVDPRDSRRVIVAVSCGGVWVTEDLGETWHCRATGMRGEFMPPERAEDPRIQDAHFVTCCRAEPDRLWCQHHNGIFRADDASMQWHEIENVEPSSFGFAVAAHPKKPDTAWFIPAIKDEKRVPKDGKLVVTRTDDGGKTFTSLKGGLPQVHAYDLVLRHALTIDDTGDQLAFGSTTGSLWFSNDGGGSWQTISNHLPPIYAVRFAT